MILLFSLPHSPLKKKESVEIQPASLRSLETRFVRTENWIGTWISYILIPSLEGGQPIPIMQAILNHMTCSKAMEKWLVHILSGQNYIKRGIGSVTSKEANPRKTLLCMVSHSQSAKGWLQNDHRTLGKDLCIFVIVPREKRTIILDYTASCLNAASGNNRFGCVVYRLPKLSQKVGPMLLVVLTFHFTKQHKQHRIFALSSVQLSVSAGEAK